MSKEDLYPEARLSRDPYSRLYNPAHLLGVRSDDLAELARERNTTSTKLAVRLYNQAARQVFVRNAALALGVPALILLVPYAAANLAVDFWQAHTMAVGGTALGAAVVSAVTLKVKTMLNWSPGPYNHERNEFGIKSVFDQALRNVDSLTKKRDGGIRYTYA